MDIAGFIFHVGECSWPSINRRWENHKGVRKNLEKLRQSYEELNCRKRDIESYLKTELIEGETELKCEVKNWLEGVEKIGLEVDGIEAEVKTVKFFSHAGLGKIVNLKIVEVEIIGQNGEFPDGLVIKLPQRGYEKPTTMILGGETTFQRKMEEIWACLLHDEVAKIGVYGMGGIGKTTALEHTHNRLLKDRKNDFGAVIWVNVSKDCSIIHLQDKIAGKLDLDLSNVMDVETRAARLYGMLNKKRFALILDDVWEVYYLHQVGIPEPMSDNGCKLVVATRSREVCHGMGCEPLIEMECLSDNEALKLFKDVVGINASNVSNLEALIKDVAGKCAGLPLAIVVVAGRLKGAVDINEWEIALEELRDNSKAESAYDQIFDRLKSSYDRLNDKRLQDCLLYCALYPEDEQIEKKLLIEHLIAEGIIEERRTRQSQISRGHSMLNTLVNSCLLNHDCVTTSESVLMHDLVRDMALKITSGSPQYMVRARVGLRCLPDEEDWEDDLVKVSLMDNKNLTTISSEIGPKKCLQLSTLLLQHNTNLKEISNNFFLHMTRLSVLDLSETDINRLPPSISDLTALTALFLRYCRKLKKVPSLAKLTNLRLLDLSHSSVKRVPNDLKMLTKLRYLNLSHSNLNSIPTEILCNLVDLQYLSLLSDFTTPKMRFEDLEKLSKLETIHAALYDLGNWNAFVRSWDSRRLVSYLLELGPVRKMRWVFRQTEKAVHLYNFSIGGNATSSERPLLVPEDVTILFINGGNLKADSLCDIASFSHVTKLKKCTITSVNKIKHVFAYSSPGIFPLLQNLESLSVTNVQNFEGLIRRNGGTPLPLPHGVFSSLQRLEIIRCHKMKKLCLISLLPNLEDLKLHSCEMLMEIGCEEEDKGKGQAVKMITLPKLKNLYLLLLPNLWSLPLIADSVEHIQIRGCGKLRKVPIIDREPVPSSLKSAGFDRETWSVFEWDHPDVKNFVQSLLYEPCKQLLSN